MDYEKLYKDALERAGNLYKDAIDMEDNFRAKQYEIIFPELKESEDEKIRKVLIDYFKGYKEHEECGTRTFYGIPTNDFLAWLEKQGKERKQLYIRFGDIPSNEKSKIYRGEEEIGYENGVSVYPAFELNGNVVLGLTLPITKTTLYTQQQLLDYDDRPCYLVSGDYVGKGTDGEPLIRNISIIKRLDNYRIKEFEKQGEQNPTWSEEDEKNLNQLHKLIVKKAYEEYEIDSEDETLWGKHAILDNWLKSLKERMKGE